MNQTVATSLLSERYVLVTWHMNKSLGCHTRKEMIKYTHILFQAETNIKEELLWGEKNESLPILFKVICCVLYHSTARCPNANHWVNYGTYTWWDMLPETGSQVEQTRHEVGSMWSYWPTLKHHQGTGIGRTPAQCFPSLPTPHTWLSASPSSTLSMHTGKAPSTALHPI